jgi:hypothetical protein
MCFSEDFEHQIRVFQKILNIEYVFLLFYNFGLKNFSFQVEYQPDVISVISLHVKCQLFLSGFIETSVFLTDFRKIFKRQIS